MKILSLLQPWATLLVRGHKQIETRSWYTHYRGPIFIHASGSLHKKFKNNTDNPFTMCSQEPFKDFIKPEELVFGKIIGSVEIVSVLETEKAAKFLPSRELDFGDYSPGRFAWQCTTPVEFDLHTDIKGQLGIRECSIATNCLLCDMGGIPAHDRYHRTPEGIVTCGNMDYSKKMCNLKITVLFEKPG